MFFWWHCVIGCFKGVFLHRNHLLSHPYCFWYVSTWCTTILHVTNTMRCVRNNLKRWCFSQYVSFKLGSCITFNKETFEHTCNIRGGSFQLHILKDCWVIYTDQFTWLYNTKSVYFHRFTFNYIVFSVQILFKT